MRERLGSVAVASQTVAAMVRHDEPHQHNHADRSEKNLQPQGCLDVRPLRQSAPPIARQAPLRIPAKPNAESRMIPNGIPR